MKKVILFIFVLGILFSSSVVLAENSEGNTTDWRMYGRWLNHTKADSSYATFPGVNNITYRLGWDGSVVVGNGSVYVIALNSSLFQLNASNISQCIASTTLNGTVSLADTYPVVAGPYVYALSRNGEIDGGGIDQFSALDVSQRVSSYTPDEAAPPFGPAVVYGRSVLFQSGRVYEVNSSNVNQELNRGMAILGTSSLAVANGFVYGTGTSGIYQFNASNITQQIANRSGTGLGTSAPAVANGFVYAAGTNVLLQLNASNVSVMVANYSLGGGFTVSAPAIAKGYVYMPSRSNFTLYQLNASNVSQQVAWFTTGGEIYASPVVYNGFVYMGSNDSKLYQLNASNISQKIGQYVTHGAIDSTPSIANGYVYFTSRDGNMYQVLAANISDQQPPQITIDAPANTTYTDANVPLSVTLNEPGQCTYAIVSVSLSSSTILSSVNTTFDASVPSVRTYNLTATCNDTVGNIQQASTVTFTVQSSSTASTCATSTSSSSSTISSGSSSVVYVYMTQAIAGMNGVKLAPGDQYQLMIGKELHTVTLNKFNDTEAKVTLQSEPVVLMLRKGEQVYADVDNDETSDISIVYEGKEGNKALLSIKLLNEKLVPDVVQPTVKDEPAQSVSNEKESSSLWWIIGALGVIIVVLVVLLIKKSK